MKIDQLTSRKCRCWPVHPKAEKAIARNCVSVIARICDAIANNCEPLPRIMRTDKILDLDTRAGYDKLSLKYYTLEINYDLL